MIAENTGGVVATDGTEQTLATITTGGVFQLVVDLSNMQNGDAVEFRAKVKIRSLSSEKTVVMSTYAHAQGADGAIAITPPLPAPYQFSATIRRVSGGDRSYEWAIYEYS